MEIKECSLPSTNPFVADYLHQTDKAMKYFDYNPNLTDTMARRAEELSLRTYKREQLVEYLYGFHQKFKCSKQTLKNIEKLRQSNAVAVVAGQQAGVLTGPLYTIHKAISIIQYANQQEKELGIPVVPVFWTAGEDHDFAEINHIYALNEEGVDKLVAQEDDGQKLPVSNRGFDKKQMRHWVERVCKHFTETVHTRTLLDSVEGIIEESDTYTDFFNRFMLFLFSEQGLVVMDSNEPNLRKLEAPFFKELIAGNEEMQRRVVNRQYALREDGYGEPISINEQNAHLFYHHDGKRILLERLQTGEFVGKNREVRLSAEQLMNVAEEAPEKLSNNVVTRPLMQEHVLPVLAFFGGPGEISYWAALKDIFHQFGYTMPPVLPRLQLTLVERHVHTWMEELGLAYEDVLRRGAGFDKEQRLAQVERKEIDDKVKQVSKQMDDLHQTLRLLAVDVDHNLTELAYKNGAQIQTQIQYLHKQMERSLRLKEEPKLRRYDIIEASLFPNRSPQERVWNVLYFLNTYGLQFVTDLCNLPFLWNDRHKIVFF